LKTPKENYTTWVSGVYVLVLPLLLCSSHHWWSPHCTKDYHPNPHVLNWNTLPRKKLLEFHFWFQTLQINFPAQVLQTWTPNPATELRSSKWDNSFLQSIIELFELA
jgi:hypothetical protein